VCRMRVEFPFFVLDVVVIDAIVFSSCSTLRESWNMMSVNRVISSVSLLLLCIILFNSMMCIECSMIE